MSAASLPLRLAAPLPPAPGAVRADARLLDRLGVERALAHRLVPMPRAGAVTPVASASPDIALDEIAGIEAACGPVALFPATEAEVTGAILAVRRDALARRAETRTRAAESCRGWSGRRAALAIVALSLVATLAFFRWPAATMLAFSAWATLTLLALTGLRTLAALVALRHASASGRHWTSSRHQPATEDAALPTISLLVPLFHEREIADRLVRRLEALRYPSRRLDICLILEEGDTATARALAGARLSPWMRVIAVPDGPLRTKPRALNYALDFARGQIVGIYDAEDAPAPDQLRRVAGAFADSGPDVACIQGVLDFYNAGQNWLTRCFALDYALWFRMVLPGLARIGLPVPLGGTTVFFRRSVLENLGRWDAHNVTEDADLGIRLARYGYRTRFMPSVTREEATASIPAWVRQRSRWIKGYAVTWAVNMRDPLRLWGELGAKGFFGFQILFLGTLSQFVLAPLLWSFWLVLFGLPHPVTAHLPWSVVVSMGAIFLFAEVATLGIAALSVATPDKRWLIWWVPLLHIYFPLAAIASWKGYAELVTRPFFWDKTDHGGTLTRR